MTDKKIVVNQPVLEVQDLKPEHLIMVPEESGQINGAGGGLLVEEVKILGNEVEIYGRHLGDLMIVKFPVGYKIALLPEIAG